MIPFANDTVTLYHYIGRDMWQRIILRGVMWRAGSANVMTQRTDGRFERRARTRVTIPYELKPDLHIDTGGKDYFVLGMGNEITSAYSPADLKKDHPELGTVKYVSDNTRAGILRHWAVELE